jgi:hypothetical protein
MGAALDASFARPEGGLNTYVLTFPQVLDFATCPLEYRQFFG